MLLPVAFALDKEGKRPDRSMVGVAVVVEEEEEEEEEGGRVEEGKEEKAKALAWGRKAGGNRKRKM